MKRLQGYHKRRYFDTKAIKKVDKILNLCYIYTMKEKTKLSQVKVPLRWWGMLKSGGNIYSRIIYESLEKYITDAAKGINEGVYIGPENPSKQLNLRIDKSQYQIIDSMPGTMSAHVRAALRKYYIRGWWKNYYIQNFKGSDPGKYKEFISNNNPENYDIAELFRDTWMKIMEYNSLPLIHPKFQLH